MNALRALPWLLLLALLAGLAAPLVDRSLAPVATLVVQLALAGLVVLYVVSAGRFWAVDRRATGVLLLDFGPEKHMAVGLAAPAQSGYRGTGYAFVETTQPTIITDAEETYVGAGRLASTPEVIVIAEGKAIGSLAQEAADLAEFRSIQAMGSVVDSYHYDRWQALVQKYGLIVGS